MPGGFYVSDESTAQEQELERDAQPAKSGGGRPWFAYVLFLVAIGFFAAAAWLYLKEDDNQIVVPTAEAGHNEMKDVMLALEANGMTAEYGRSADRALGLTEVAQPIVIGEETVYVFIYPDAEQRERDQERIDPATLQIVNTRGTPTAEGTPHVAGGSNVLVITYSTDAEFTSKLDEAIAGLR